MEKNNTQQNLPVEQKNISELVLTKINQFQQDGSMVLPQNYAVENHLKSAWLILQGVTDRDGRSALQVCTKDSVANALLDMVLQGLSVAKKQGYFIVYGNQLVFQRSYFGTVALAKRVGMPEEPVANIIYEGDEFIYQIDPKTGLTEIVKHVQKLENIDNAKIKGAYCIATLPSGKVQVTLMTIAQIRAAWGQGATKGNSPAHKNFGEEMAKKSVINRCCKTIINSSTDAWLFEGKRDESDVVENATEQREALKSARANKEQLGEVVDFEEVGNKVQEQQKQEESQTDASNGSQSVEDGPGY